ncbi:MAG TPA: helix-turn-helix transcriptional regulator [Arachnia sp.]|nr:helix-turn-helix transcriptional regulator [Arachnia sp.]HMT84757.1 helix-turn-helix transcriptional regulator [Arachnia sp.]
MGDVREMRRSAGLSQSELGRRTGIAVPNLSAYETGRRQPSAETLARIADACRRRPSEVLERDRARIVAILAECGVTAWAFGSVARGEDRWDSDLDLLVDLPDDFGYLRLARLKRRLDELGIEVDLVPRGALDPTATSGIDHRILSEAVPL